MPRFFFNESFLRSGHTTVFIRKIRLILKILKTKLKIKRLTINNVNITRECVMDFVTTVLRP